MFWRWSILILNVPNHRVEKPFIIEYFGEFGALSLMIFHVRVLRNAKTKGIGSVIVRGGSLWWNPRPGCGFSSTTSRQQEGARLAQWYKQSRIHQCLCLPCVLATSVSFPSPLSSCSSSFFFPLNPPWSSLPHQKDLYILPVRYKHPVGGQGPRKKTQNKLITGGRKPVSLCDCHVIEF